MPRAALLRAPGHAAPRRATPEQRQQVLRILREHERDVERLTDNAAAKMLPILAQAEQELTARLASWTETAEDGELRWTAQSYRAALAQIKRAGELIHRGMGQTLDVGARQAQRLALQHLVDEVARFSQVFEGTARVLPLDAARLLADGSAYIIPRMRTSAARYAWRGWQGTTAHPGVAEDMRRRLAVDILAGASVSSTIDRLQEHGGPRGIVALRGVLGDPGARVEDIPEGLFTRYRSWAARVVRTEMMSAYNAQLLDGMQTAAKHIPGLVKRWTAEPGACALVCLPLAGETVALDEPFDTALGAVDHAPAHPNCRCRSGVWKSDWPDAIAPRPPPRN